MTGIIKTAYTGNQETDNKLTMASTWLRDSRLHSPRLVKQKVQQRLNCGEPLGPGHTERRLMMAFGWSRGILKELPRVASAGPICRSYEAIYFHTAQKRFYWSWPRTLQNSSSKLQDQGNRENLSSFLLFPSLLFLYMCWSMCVFTSVHVCMCICIHVSRGQRSIVEVIRQ